jgi:hypothetical protein
MRKVLFGWVLSTAAVLGAAAVTPSTLSFSMRARGENPYRQDVAVTGAANALSARCTSGSPNDACTSLSWAFDATTAPTTLHVFFNGYNNSSYIPGEYTATLQVSSNTGCTGSCNIAVTLTVVPATPANITSISGSFIGCSNRDSAYIGDFESCVIPGQRPGGSFNPPPSPCGSYTDPNFGGTIKRLTATGTRVLGADSMQKAWNGNGTLVMTGTQSGSGFLVDVNTCADEWPNIPGNAASFDPMDATGRTYYTLDGNSVTRRVLAPNSTVESTPIYTFAGPGTAAHLTNGGDGDVIKDGYWCFYTEGGTATQLVLLNVRTGAYVQFDYSTITFMSSPLRSCTLAKGFSPTNGKLYIVLGNFGNVHGVGSSGPNEILSWRAGDTTITDEGPQPLPPLAAAYGFYSGTDVTNAACAVGLCRYQSHMDTVEADGHEFLVYGGGPSQTTPQVNPPHNSNYAYSLFECLDCGPIPNMELDAESGGNAYYVGPFTESDGHISCARLAPVCLAESNNDPGLQAATITNIVNNNTGGITVTIQGTSPVVTGDPLLINANGGCTSANGRFTGDKVTVLGSTINIAGVTCNSAFTSGGSLTKDITSVPYPHQAELILLDATHIMSRRVDVTLLGKHRSVAYSHDAPSDTHYYGQSHPNINDLGTMGVFESNFGFPGVTDVYLIQTGYSARTSTSTFSLTMIAGPGGTVSPLSNSFGSGQTVQITATPNVGYTFDGWVGFGTGSYTGSHVQSSVTLSGPVSEVASFSPQCTYALTPGAQVVPAAGGKVTESITTGTGCAWSAVTNSSWITVSSGPTGPGTGLVSFTVEANAGVGRNGSLTIAGQQVTITQAGHSSNSPPLSPVLSITEIHDGSFTQGQQNAAYTVTLSNAMNAGTTSGTVTVTETVAPGLSLVSMSGTAWACQSNTCSRSDGLAPGASYPAITVLVNVGNGISSPQVSTARVSGGGSAAATVSDSTVITGRVGTLPRPVHRKVGVYRNGFWYVDRDGSNQWEGPASDPGYHFGVPGDIPVVGDWDGSGSLRIGVYRGGSWYVDLDGNHQWDGEPTDRVFNFGVPGDIPVVGDWDGTGKLRIGVYRGGFWYLDMNGNNQWDGPLAGDRIVNFGVPGDIPVVGDWDGTGKLRIGVYRNGAWFVDLNGNLKWDGEGVDAIFRFGVPGDLPVVADWDNGQLKLGIYRSGLWYVDLNGDFKWDSATDHIFPFGLPGDIPVAGPWY